jgi:hypothetical protein
MKNNIPTNEHSFGNSPEYVVKLPEKGGLGVLVGEVILTAARCLTCTPGEIVGSDEYIEHIETRHGRLQTSVLAMERVRDIAVLGRPDLNHFPAQAEFYQQFCESTPSVALAKAAIPPGQPIPVMVHNCLGKWVDATARLRVAWSPSLYIEAQEPIQSAAAGGPILDKQGRLIAVVSQFWFRNGVETVDGFAPRPLFALPVWVVSAHVDQHNSGCMTKDSFGG